MAATDLTTMAPLLHEFAFHQTTGGNSERFQERLPVIVRGLSVPRARFGLIGCIGISSRVTAPIVSQGLPEFSLDKGVTDALANVQQRDDLAGVNEEPLSQLARAPGAAYT
jgi:hypothetical protein